MAERISCTHSVLWGVATGLRQAALHSCPRAGTPGRCTAAPGLPPSSLLREPLCSCREWPWRTTLTWLLLFFFPRILFFIGVSLLYHAVLVSAAQRRKSAMCMHKSPPS